MVLHVKTRLEDPVIRGGFKNSPHNFNFFLIIFFEIKVSGCSFPVARLKNWGVHIFCNTFFPLVKTSFYVSLPRETSLLFLAPGKRYLTDHDVNIYYFWPICHTDIR